MAEDRRFDGRAVIDTARGDFNGVLNALGRNQKEVPIMDAMDAAATAFRANALERIGDFQGATACLQQYMGAGGASGRMAMQGVIARYAQWNLCQQTMQAAQSQYAQRASSAAAARSGGGIGVLFFYIGLLTLAGGVIAMVLAIFGIGSFFTAPTPLIIGVVFTLVGRGIKNSAAKAAYLREHGISCKGSVVGIQRTGVKINNVPQFNITVQVMRDGQAPYNASAKMLLPPGSAGQFKPGLVLPVRVDPNDPQAIMIELD